MSLIDLIQQQLGPSEIQQISGQIGADPAQTQRAVQAAVPLMLGGLAQTAQSPEGKGTIRQAVGEQQTTLGTLGGVGDFESMLGGQPGGQLADAPPAEAQQLGGLGGALGGVLGGALGGGGLGGLGGLLGRVLGGNEDQVQSGVQQASGLNSDQTRRLLVMLAPIVLGMLARRRANAQKSPQAQAAQDDDDDDLGGTLQREAQTARERAEHDQPQLGGLLGELLERVITPRPGR